MGRYSSAKARAAFNRLPAKIGALAVRFYQKNFQRQGYDDTAFKRWQKPKNPTGRKLLQDTGKLASSFQYLVAGKTVRVFNTTPYAKYHNFGTDKLPKRPIIYRSEDLKKELLALMKKQIIKALT